MRVLAFLVPWFALGIAVLFVAFSGGPSRARQAYLTKGSRLFTSLMVLLYVGLGVAVPALVIGNRDQASGATGQLADNKIPEKLELGKMLFRETCASCHSLAAVNARGVTGPSLDQIGEVTPERIATAIKLGGTGQARMPAELLQGDDAQLVADYVAEVAGK